MKEDPEILNSTRVWIVLMAPEYGSDECISYSKPYWSEEEAVERAKLALHPDRNDDIKVVQYVAEGVTTVRLGESDGD